MPLLNTIGLGLEDPVLVLRSWAWSRPWFYSKTRTKTNTTPLSAATLKPKPKLARLGFGLGSNLVFPARPKPRLHFCLEVKLTLRSSPRRAFLCKTMTKIAVKSRSRLAPLGCGTCLGLAARRRPAGLGFSLDLAYQ